MQGLWIFLSWLFWVLEWCALAALGCMGFALNIDLSTHEEKRRLFLHDAVECCQSHATEIGASLAFFVLVTRFGRWASKRKSEEARIIDRLITDALEKFRRSVFPENPENVPDDQNRVTVFRHHKLLWWISPFRGICNPWGWGRGPGSGWLVVAYRSGHVTQKGGATFLAPDDAHNTEGVAGMAWRSGACRVGKEEHRLPDLKDVQYAGLLRAIWFRLRRYFGLPLSADESAFFEACNKVETYAKMTKCSTKFVWQRIKRGRPNPTSLLAVQLKDHKKAPWGVLVMDSCNDIECINTKEPAFRQAFTKLTNELERLNVL